jgi:hypothetical protein
MSAKPRQKEEEILSSLQMEQPHDENSSSDEVYPSGKDFIATVTALLLAFIIIGLVSVCLDLYSLSQN